jgi:hypothetical protein
MCDSRVSSAHKGSIGCGCLLFIVILVIIISGVSIHPFTLKLVARYLNYSDTILPADVVFVPRFPEDKAGEVYTEAFRQYWQGNGTLIWMEDDKILGFSLSDLVSRMAKERNIKEDIVRKIDLKGNDIAKAQEARELFVRMKYRKVIIIVPEYAARMFHRMYDSKEGKTLPIFLVKPVDVSYFRGDLWWKDASSRRLVGREIFRMGRRLIKGFGGTTETVKEEDGKGNTKE